MMASLFSNSVVRPVRSLRAIVVRCSAIVSLLCIAATSPEVVSAAEINHRPDGLVADKQSGETGPELLPPGTPVSTGDAADGGKRAQFGYRWQNGHWWYHLASGQWLIWTGDRWRSVSTPTQTHPPISSRRAWAESRGYANLPPALRPTNHGWVGGFYSSGGGYGASDFGYGYGIPTYGPYRRP